MSEIDDRIRAAALAHVRQLRDRFGSRIPGAALSEGIRLDGERIPIWNYQKGIFKPAALGRDGAALSVQTSIKSPYGDVRDYDAGHIVYKYQGRDPHTADNVALRRAMVTARPLIYLIAVDAGFYDAIIPAFVVNDDPASLQFTLMADQANADLSLADAGQTVLRREYVTRAVLHRLHQHEFRRMVLMAYREQCCICRLRHVQLLDAAHILPDRHPQGEPVVTNGLGFCKIHHSAYDAHIIGVDADARVHVRTDILDEIDGPMLLHGIQEMDGTRLALPRNADLRPNRDFLAERFDRFRAA